MLALAGEGELAAADLTRAPDVQPVPPRGTNVELVVPLGETTSPSGDLVGRVRMRVHERGVGETRSCGTGACAAALAVRTWAGAGAPDVWLVDVPGGTLRVRVLPTAATSSSPGPPRSSPPVRSTSTRSSRADRRRPAPDAGVTPPASRHGCRMIRPEQHPPARR